MEETKTKELLGALKGRGVKEARESLKILREKSGRDFEKKRKALFKY